FEKLQHCPLGDWLAVYRDSLPEIDQVRRRVFPDLEPLGAEQGFAGGDDASLAVGSSDVNRRELAVGRAHFGEKGFRALETWFYAAGGAGEKSLDRLAV